MSEQFTGRPSIFQGKIYNPGDIDPETAVLAWYPPGNGRGDQWMVVSPWRLNERRHDGTPPMLTWGYFGEGPRRTAWVLLWHTTEDPALADRLAVQFMHERIGQLDRLSEWMMYRRKIEEWIASATGED
jgi:hypothetical protein